MIASIPRLSAVLVLLLVTSGLTIAAEPEARATNVIVVFVDDLGWKDLSCQGSAVDTTPAIDHIATEGMRFTTAYSACTVCSPSRAAMMTGRHPARLHITDWIKGHARPQAQLLPPDWQQALPLEEVTVAERLKTKGYATAAIGKWHLGDEAVAPEHQGFDLALGGSHIGHPPSYFAPHRLPGFPDGPPGDYLTDREAAEAVAFIEAHRDEPFFLYLAHYAVHTPIQAKPEAVARIADAHPGLSPTRAAYAAMIESVDEAIGRITATLDRLGLRDRTAIIVTSDNGGQESITDMRPCRAGKGSAYEGGVRVPLIIMWPGVTEAGSTSDVPVITPDIPATILDLTGVGPDPDRPLDGRSLAAVLRGGTLARDDLFWHYPHYHPGGATPYSAIRSGSWRLVHYYEDDRDELYDLASDPGERVDLSASHADRAMTLRGKLVAWLAEVGAQMPVPNPHHDAARNTP